MKITTALTLALITVSASANTFDRFTTFGMSKTDLRNEQTKKSLKMNISFNRMGLELKVKGDFSRVTSAILPTGLATESFPQDMESFPEANIQWRYDLTNKEIKVLIIGDKAYLRKLYEKMIDHQSLTPFFKNMLTTFEYHKVELSNPLTRRCNVQKLRKRKCQNKSIEFIQFKKCDDDTQEINIQEYLGKDVNAYIVDKSPCTTSMFNNQLRDNLKDIFLTSNRENTIIPILLEKKYEILISN